jgi:cell division protein ZapE
LRAHPRLADRRPELSPDELVARLVPPHRFAGVRFDTYVPNPEHPSQAAALIAIRAFAAAMADPAPPGRRRLFRRAAAPHARSAGRYLDGGYGVGKTHLLAALWHSVPDPKAYLTFAELTSAIGFLGMKRAVEAFSANALVCIDEFELDDVANTLMVVSFLRAVIAAGVRVATTSNTLPEKLGEGRFHADDFRREIAAIAAHFETVRVDGPDYRARARVDGEPVGDEELDAVVAALPGQVSVDHFDALLAHLRDVHPVRFPAMLDGLDAVVVRGLHPIPNQGDALLFAHLLDELYDAEVAFAASGCGVGQLFPAAYRRGGYRKKYGRAESRLSAMLAETWRG